MSYFDADQFKRRIDGMADDELIALVTINSKNLVGEAISMAQSEIVKRGLADDVQNPIFDLFLNTSGFAGRLVLLEEQIMFLSTCLAAGGGKSGGSGLIGAIASEGQLATRRVAAANLDFSALDNEGSWIYYLDQIQSCRANSSFMSGKQLVFEIEEEDGKVTNGVVQCGSISKEELELLAAQILDAKTKFETK